MTLVDGLAAALVGLSLLAPLLARASAGDARPGFAMTIELGTAGALLRLTGDASWQAILAAAAMVLFRQVVRADRGIVVHLALRR